MHPHVFHRHRRPRPLTRQFERSHLEPQLVASAYECACPFARRILTSRISTPATPPLTRTGASAAGGRGG